MKRLTKLHSVKDHGLLVHIQFTTSIPGYPPTEGRLYWCNEGKMWFILTRNWDGAYPLGSPERAKEFKNKYEPDLVKRGQRALWRAIGDKPCSGTSYQLFVPIEYLTKEQTKEIDNLIELL